MKITKKALRIALIILVLIPVLLILRVYFLLGGSDFREYPQEKAAHWVCEEPHFEIHFAGEVTESFLEWRGEKIRVFVGMRADYFDVFLQTKPVDPLEQENILLRGTWKYVKGKMVVRIDEDNIFNGAYSELVFVPQYY